MLSCESGWLMVFMVIHTLTEPFPDAPHHFE